MLHLRKRTVQLVTVAVFALIKTHQSTSQTTSPPYNSSTQAPTTNGPVTNPTGQTPTSVAPASNSSQAPTSSAAAYNSTQAPTSSPAASNSAQPPTSSPAASNSTQAPTSSPAASNSTQPPTSSAVSNNSIQAPTSSPAASNSTQPPTSSPAASNSTQVPTSSPAASNSTQPPTSSPAASNSTQVPTSSPAASNSTQAPTSSPAASNSTQAPTSSPAASNSTQAPTSFPPVSNSTLQPQPITTQQPLTASPLSTVPFRVIFRWTAVKFHLQLLDSSSSTYQSFEAKNKNLLTSNLAPYVTAVKLLFIRPGSVEVTAALIVRKRDDIPQLEQRLGNLNRSGMLGNDSWIATYWESEDPTCLPPPVSIQNLPVFSTKQSAVNILRSKDFIVQTNVTKSSCNSSQTLLFEWYLYRYDVGQSGEIDVKSVALLDSKSAEWNSQKRQLDYGRYFVDFRAAFASHPRMIGSALGFFNITKSPLRADISGGNRVTRGKGSIIKLNGSLSRDPDLEPDDTSLMHFTWLCKQRRESFPSVSIASIPVVSLSHGPSSGGCFGTGVGKLSSNDAIVNLETSAMAVGEFYDVKLIASKDDRKDDFVQEIEIVRGNPPEVTIRCLINCEKNASASTRISLTTTCTGHACDTAMYQWQLVSLDPHGMEIPERLERDMTQTELNISGIIIKANQLKGGSTYRLKVDVNQVNEPSGIAAYQFRINAPPQRGQCTVTPKTGEALKIKFNFKCSGWEDIDKPLTYQFHYKTGNGLYTVVSYGSEDHVTTVLPPGQKSNDYDIDFEILVIDSLSAATQNNIKVKVKPASASDEDLSGLTVGNSSQLNQLVQLGDARGATQLANAVLQTIEQSVTTAIDKKIEIKSSIIKEVSNIKAANLQSLTQVTSIIARATLEPSQVTADTQNIALQTLSSLTSLLQSKTKEDYASESNLVEEGGENLVLSFGNLLNSAAQKASVIENAKEPEVIQSESRKISKDTETLLDSVGTTLLSRMVVDQEPHRIKTNSLDMLLNRLSPNSLETNGDVTKDDVGFKLPFKAITDAKAKHAQFVDSVMTVSSFNPFTWDKTSSLVKSHVLSLVLKDHNGKTLTVKDSKEDVELKMARNPKEEPESKESFFVKSSSEGKMQYHKINLAHADGSAIRLTIKPVGSPKFSVFVRYGQRPTITGYDTKARIPDESCLLSSQGQCGKQAYDILLIQEVLSKPGPYYIGILHEKSGEDAKTRKRRSCSGSGRQKRSCVVFKDPPRPENITVKPVYDPKTDTNYSLSIKREECLFWNSKEERWLSDGCKVGPRSTPTSLHCLCNHLTSFGGGVLVMPNTLDFDVVFSELTKLHETGNVAVLAAIIAALLLHVLVVIFARKADIKDKAKTGPALHLNLSPDGRFQYELTVATGVWKDSGTDANVAIVIHGSEAESKPIILNKDMMKSRTVLARGNEDFFVIHLSSSLGEVQYIHVWHDNSGKHPSWYFGHLLIKDPQTGKRWTFLGNCWFALEKGDGKIDRLLTPISPEETKTFKYSLNSRGSKKFTEGHLWLSVVTKPPKSKFTRVQRATCCLCLLMSAMLANALFYRTDKVADPTIQIGPLKFSWRQIVVGLESALIVTPVNVLIMLFFKRSAEKRSNKVQASVTRRRASTRSRSYSPLSETVDIKLANVTSMEKNTFFRRTLECVRAFGKKDVVLPHYFKYIAWFLSFVTVASSATFTFFFSLQWGKDISNQWLSSMLVSFTEDLFVLQPIKIVLIMVITACLLSENEPEVVGNPVKSDQLTTVDTNQVDDLKSIMINVPQDDNLRLAREYRVKEAKMFSFGRELIGYLFFVSLLTIVCYGNRNYHGYLISKNLKDDFSNFSLAKDPKFYWKWIGGQFLDGIYANEWYNGEKAKEQEYIYNKKSILLGMPRLRQLRVKKDSCTVPEEARHVIKHCNNFYSFDEEDRNPLNLPGWRPFGGSVNWANFTDLCPAPWNYVPQEKVQNNPSWGFFNLYDGGGYVAYLGYNKTTAAPLIASLHKYGWIDRRTRVVLLEFVIYNPSTGYISISTFYYEMLPTGYGNPFARIDTFPLTNTQTGFYQFYLICQLLFIIMVIMFVLQEVYQIYRMRCSYFQNAWNWVEILQIIFSLLVVIFFVVKSKLVLKSALKVKENPFVPVSFQSAVQWNDAENGVLAILVFIVTLKLLRMIRFNPHISILISSFRESRGLLLSYSVIFIIVFLAYAQLGRLVLGSDIQSYSSFLNTLFSELLMCLGGKMGIRELVRSNRILGPLFGFSFVLLNSFIFVNFFVSILNDSYEEVKDNTDKQSKEFEMADFILERIREIFGFGKLRPKDENDGSKLNNSITAEDDPGIMERQREKEKPSVSFATVAFQSHRLRHRVRKIHQRKKRTSRKEKKLREVNFNEKKRTVVESTTYRRKHHLKLVVSSIIAMHGLYEENALRRLDLLTSKIARDDVREDIELLSLIRLLHLFNSAESEVASSETDSTPLDDAIEMCSLATFSSQSSMAITFTEEARSSASEDCSDDDTLELLKSRASFRQLPPHLRGKQLHDRLRSAVTQKHIQPAKRKDHSFTIFKYYSFI